MPKVKMYK